MGGSCRMMHLIFMLLYRNLSVFPSCLRDQCNKETTCIGRKMGRGPIGRIHGQHVRLCMTKEDPQEGP